MHNKTPIDYSPIKGEIMTRWASKIDPETPLPEYPRPQMVREEWANLNGLWNYAIRPEGIHEIFSYDGKILVPFPIESSLSGVKKKLKPKERLWYKRNFKTPSNWDDKKILLHFGAVDWSCEIWINKAKIGEHVGGYVPFSFNITEYLNNKGNNEIMISVWDPTNKKGIPRGKQHLNPYGIWYTAASGIWQTVWIEPVSETYIKKLKILPDIDSEILNLDITIVNPKDTDEYIIFVKDKNTIITEIRKNDLKDLKIMVPNPQLWSTKNPYLYDLTIQIKRKDVVVDKIESYFGMRKISIKEDNEGNKRLALNNEIFFQYGPLDQGYWPDGIYTAPTDNALKYDIEITKELGFNMIRKHVKVEPARWYYHCDRLGVLVWQDMPSGGKTGLISIAKGFIRAKITKKKDLKRHERDKKNFYEELQAMIENLHNHPSIVVWVPFNEGWGQFETAKVLDFIRELDQSRLIDSASGWFDHQIGDIADCHKYVGPGFPKNVGERVPICGEFGGLGYKVNGHIWEKKFRFVYKKFSNPSELLNFYSELVNKLKKLKKEGLAAAIYTQTTDVEGEINGIITYDRELIKMDKEQLKNINLSVYK